MASSVSSAASTSRLDTIYRRLLLTGYFTRGWGKPDHIKRIFTLRRQVADRNIAASLVDPDHPVVVEKEERFKDHRLVKCSFISPCVHYLDEELLPQECRRAHFELVLPVEESRLSRVPLVLHYAGTGDHYFWRRRKFSALPLLQERGLASAIIENPFYGLRKPREQRRSQLRNVTDIFVMGACLILETLAMFRWFHRKHSFGPVVSHGISMGGHMATLSATVLPEPVGVVPCLSWTSASLTFTEGVMSGAINWPLLERQLLLEKRYRGDILAMCSTDAAAFRDGVSLARSIDDTEERERRQAVELERKEALLSKVYRSLDGVLNLLRLKRGSSSSSSELQRQEAYHFMRGIMDECTHLRNFALPVDPSLCVAVAAERDAYQPREGVSPIDQVWPGSTIKYLEGEGHVSSYLFKQRVFRQTIYEVIDAMKEKYQW